MSSNSGFFETELKRAITLHTDGKIAQAIAAYEKLLYDQSEHYDCLHLLGVAYYQQGQLDEARLHIEHAIRLKPEIADAHSNLGLVLHQLGRSEEALARFERAINLKPRYADALSNKGAVLLDLEQPHLAVDALLAAVDSNPSQLQAHFNLARAYFKLNQYADAVSVLKSLLGRSPLHTDGLMLLGDAFNAMGQPASALQAYLQVISVTPLVARAHGSAGLMLQRLGCIQEAISRYRQALQLDPNMVEVQCNLGTAYQLEQRLEDAVAQYEAAIALNPDLAVAHCNRGTALLDMGDLGGALQSYGTAVAIDPNYPEALSNRGATLHKLGLFKQALVSYDQAISVRPDYASAHWNKSITQLLCGDFDAGWPSYEWRWRWDHFPSPRRTFSCPQWTGQTPLNGMTVLVHAEQGLGDTIQFVRYVPLIKALGASVVLEVPRVLLGLIRGVAGEVQLVAAGDPLPDTDFYCPMASLPLAFKTNLDSIPSAIPYLHAEPYRVERWARVLGDQGLRLGICWQGKATAKVDQGRSFPLKMLKPLSEVPGVRLISLHKGAGEAQLQDLPPGMAVQTLGPHFDEDGAFLDTAAVMKHCHLVITSDTAIAHLAGALGVPVWVALKFVPDWRWLLNRSDSPWYPTMRLFRQSAPGDWGPVFNEMALHLQIHASGVQMIAP